MAAELSRDGSPPLVAVEKFASGQEALVGFVVFWTIMDEVHVLDLAVDPSRRRLGVASALVDAMVEEAKKQGARLLILEVRRGNLPARNLYGRKGFRPVAVRPRYYVEEGEDAILMELELSRPGDRVRNMSWSRLPDNL